MLMCADNLTNSSHNFAWVLIFYPIRKETQHIQLKNGSFVRPNRTSRLGRPLFLEPNISRTFLNTYLRQTTTYNPDETFHRMIIFPFHLSISNHCLLTIHYGLISNHTLR